MLAVISECMLKRYFEDSDMNSQPSMIILQISPTHSYLHECYNKENQEESLNISLNANFLVHYFRKKTLKASQEF